MTSIDGDMDEMPVPNLDERALDALLSGAPAAQSGFDWLVPFVEDLGGAASTAAPVVKPALAALLTQGFSTEKGDLPATAASNVTGPAPQAAGLPKWRKKKMLISELLAGLATKLAGLGLVAKAGLGLTLAAASTTAAGAAGVLPSPAQHAVATVVDAATPFTFPNGANVKTNFGATVSTDATGASDGVPGVNGKAVSDAAKDKAHTDGSTPTTTDTVAPGTSTAVGANNGATGLDRANQTPAAGHVPTSVPAATGTPVAPGSQASNGLSTANSTPAAGHVPSSVPPVTPAGPSGSGGQGSPGLSTAASTPAAGQTPARTPGRP
jgi:hypothetical protein